MPQMYPFNIYEKQNIAKKSSGTLSGTFPKKVTVKGTFSAHPNQYKNALIFKPISLFHRCQRQYTNPYILHIDQTGSTCQSSRTGSQHIVNYQYVFPCKCFGMLKFKDTFHIIPTFKHRFTRLRFRIFLT